MGGINDNTVMRASMLCSKYRIARNLSRVKNLVVNMHVMHGLTQRRHWIEVQQINSKRSNTCTRHLHFMHEFLLF